MKKFILKFIWFEKYIAVSLDQKVGDKTILLTEYFFLAARRCLGRYEN